MSDKSVLYGEQAEALQGALMSAFFNRDELDQFLYNTLEKSLDEIVADDAPGLDKLVVAVVRDAEKNGWLDALVRAAFAARPGNSVIAAFHAKYITTSPAKLTREDRGVFIDAMLAGFIDKSDLEQLLAYKLSRDLDQIAGLATITRAVIRRAEAEGWTDTLIRSACAERPGNVAIKRFHDRYTAGAQRACDAAIASLPGDEPSRLERMVTAFQYVSVRAWREKLEEVERRVCRIEYLDMNGPKGTGFLVGPDLVLTNYHVLTKLLNDTGLWHPNEITVRFDYYELPDGSVSAGRPHKLHPTAWRIAASPPSALDEVVGTTSPPTTELDYALVRLATRAADDEVDGEPRGFFPFQKGQVEFKADMGLVIAQHPEGKPMKLAIDPAANVWLNDLRTRVRYRTNTEKGSSGSPCFDMGWRLIALHHSGDPAKTTRAQYNEGIPLDTLRDHLPQCARDALGW